MDEESDLNDILDTMHVPPDRRSDYHWLIRNLGIRNSENPRYPRAKVLLKILVGRTG